MCFEFRSGHARPLFVLVVLHGTLNRFQDTLRAVEILLPGRGQCDFGKGRCSGAFMRLPNDSILSFYRAGFNFSAFRYIFAILLKPSLHWHRHNTVGCIFSMPRRRRAASRYDKGLGLDHLLTWGQDGSCMDFTIESQDKL
jgi:hypothetical protein